MPTEWFAVIDAAEVDRSYAEPDNHEDPVVIEDGRAMSCPCAANKHYDNAPKHPVAVAMCRPIIDFATDVIRCQGT